MSDFLTRLAARSLRPTQTIAPRLASLFEPVQAPATSLQSALTERSETAVVSNSSIPTAAAEAPTSPAVVATRSVGEAAGMLSSKAAAPVVQTVPTSAAKGVWDERLAGMTGPPPGHLANELTRQGPDAVNTGFSLTGQATLATQDSWNSQVPSSQPAAPVAASRATPAPVLEERHLLIAAKPPAGLELGNFALVARADRAAQTSHHPESSVTAAEPSIQVTIGRIEVRAEKDPTPTARVEPAMRAKPLDDYLRERSGRGSQ